MSEEVIRDCKSAYDWALENPSSIAQTFFDEDDGQYFFNDGQAKGNTTVFKELLEKHGRVWVKACQDLWGLGPEGNVWFYGAETFHKKGTNSHLSPFHQDSIYIPFYGEQIAQIWFNF